MIEAVSRCFYSTFAEVSVYLWLTKVGLFEAFNIVFFPCEQLIKHRFGFIDAQD